MAKVPVDNLLKPKSADQPCGPPLDEDIELGNLWREIENDSKGKPEQQFGDTIIEAKPADWKAIHPKCVRLLESCLHLEPAIYLCAAAVEVDGIPGLRDGLKLISGMLDNYWTEFYPLPDEDDPEDYWEREGIFDLLTPAFHETPDDLLKFVERTRNSVLAQSPQVGKVTHKDIIGNRTGAAGAPTREFMLAAFSKTDPDYIQKVTTAVEESKQLLESIRGFLEGKMGGSAPDLIHLITELNDIARVIPEMMGGEAAGGGNVQPDPFVQPAANPGLAAAPVTGGGAVSVSTPGALNSREDIIKSLNSIISYYEANEPASPVPLLLKRAKALVNNDFLEIIKNFRPDPEKDFLTFFGVKDEPGDISSPPSSSSSSSSSSDW